mgnify:CR=1 FL=1
MRLRFLLNFIPYYHGLGNLNLMMIYYQCDIASYTEDAGGIKFLEHLFEYNNGKKIFDVDEGLLKMSPKYWEMYKRLKNEIEKTLNRRVGFLERGRPKVG